MDLGLAMLQRWWRLVYLPHFAVGIAGWVLLLGYFLLAGRSSAAR